MQMQTASAAKQNFGELLRAAQDAPVAITKHGNVLAYIVSPSVITQPDPLVERRQARFQQSVVEKDRLLRHQSVAIKLLSSSESEAMNLVANAKQVVARWANAEPSLCSHHYIALWNEILGMPIPDQAASMCRDFKGWGNALRQNSPWNVIEINL